MIFAWIGVSWALTIVLLLLAIRVARYRLRRLSGRLNHREEFEWHRMSSLLYDREAQEPSPRTEGTGRDD